MTIVTTADMRVAASALLASGVPAVLLKGGHLAGDDVVDLLATPDGISNTSLQLEYLPSGDRCTGEVTGISNDGRGFTGWCALAGATPARRTITGHWQASDAPGLVGTIASAPA